MFNKSFLKKNLTYFLDIYKNRPVKNNQSGMKIDHCFALFCLLKKIKPSLQKHTSRPTILKFNGGDKI